MSMKLKVLGLGLLAVLATSAFAAMNAAGETTGHFNSPGNTHVTLVGTEGGPENHRLHLYSNISESIIGCDEATYHGTTQAETVESVTIKPTYKTCYTTNTNPRVNVEVTTNGCDYTFKVTRTAAAPNHPDIEAGLTCPNANVGIEVHHPNCTITILPQTVSNAGTYTTITTTTKKHALTLNVNAKFADQYHGGICVFLGTSHTGELKGSVTVEGRNTAEEAVDITAT